MHVFCSRVRGKAYNIAEALQRLEALRKGLLEYIACLLIHLLAEQAQPTQERTSLYVLLAPLDQDRDPALACTASTELHNEDAVSEEHWVWAVEQIQLSDGQVTGEIAAGFRVRAWVARRYGGEGNWGGSIVAADNLVHVADLLHPCTPTSSSGLISSCHSIAATDHNASQQKHTRTFALYWMMCIDLYS